MQQLHGPYPPQNMLLLNPFDTNIDANAFGTALNGSSFSAALGTSAFTPSLLDIGSAVGKPHAVKHTYTRSVDSAMFTNQTYAESYDSPSAFDSPTTCDEDYVCDEDCGIREPTEVIHGNPPPGILVTQVPYGFRPVLLDLARCPRDIIRRTLHEQHCDKRPGVAVDDVRHCECALHEFDHQPDVLFGKRLHPDDDESPEGSASEAEDSDSHREALKEQTKIRIKRPPNSFMLYRRSRHNELVKLHRGGNKVVSKMIADEWHSLDRDKKRAFEKLAADKKREHELLYPNYKFTPKRARK